MSILRKIATNKAVTAMLLLFELLSLFIALSQDSLDWLIVAVLLLVLMVILAEVRIKVAIGAVENDLWFR